MTATDFEITLCIERFDFEKVIKTMEVLEWRWMRDGAYYYPTENDLRACAVRLLQQVVAKPTGYETATGGFRAQKVKGDERDYIELSFEIESSDTEHL